MHGNPHAAGAGQSGFLTGLGDGERAAIVAAATVVHRAAGEPLFHQEDLATATFMLQRGRVRLVQHTPEGRQVILRLIGPGELIGIVAALESAVYPATAEAVQDSEFLRWDSATLQGLLESYPRLALNLLPFLIARVHEVQDRFRELATERVEQRIARLLLRLVRQAGEKSDEGVRIRMHLTRQDLAEMSGTTLYTVSRILSKWEEQGFIDGDRHSIRLRRPHAIVTIAEDLPDSP